MVEGCIESRKGGRKEVCKEEMWVDERRREG